jgi:hypothetical protein
MFIAGIDPGRQGYIVVLDALNGRLWRQRLTYDDNKILEFERINLLPKIDVCYVEKVHGRGGWMARSNFGLGSYFGQVCLALRLYGIEAKFVTPSVWQKDFNAGKTGKSKEKTLQSYVELFPQNPLGLKINDETKRYNDNMLDALMLAAYGVKDQGLKLASQWRLGEYKEV